MEKKTNKVFKKTKQPTWRESLFRKPRLTYC
jgi:hypothetical protein